LGRRFRGIEAHNDSSGVKVHTSWRRSGCGACHCCPRYAARTTEVGRPCPMETSATFTEQNATRIVLKVVPEGHISILWHESKRKLLLRSCSVPTRDAELVGASFNCQRLWNASVDSFSALIAPRRLRKGVDTRPVHQKKRSDDTHLHWWQEGRRSEHEQYEGTCAGVASTRPDPSSRGSRATPVSRSVAWSWTISCKSDAKKACELWVAGDPGLQAGSTCKLAVGCHGRAYRTDNCHRRWIAGCTRHTQGQGGSCVATMLQEEEVAEFEGC